ncbi:hypothetical protein C0T31_07915 [Dysgonamonadaceae bacterium]|nr:hypothetical protein C0T31_07915 [Dysgonamonadaceae bacterium]
MMKSKFNGEIIGTSGFFDLFHSAQLCYLFVKNFSGLELRWLFSVFWLTYIYRYSHLKFVFLYSKSQSQKICNIP